MQQHDTLGKQVSRQLYICDACLFLYDSGGLLLDDKKEAPVVLRRASSSLSSGHIAGSNVWRTTALESDTVGTYRRYRPGYGPVIALVAVSDWLD
jgi:hypothetical protein